MTPTRRVVLLTAAAMLLLQSAWLLATPPFRGMDEFDHAYRAAGVASGQWQLDETAPGIRGDLVWVPKDLHDAAVVQCESLQGPYASNCRALESTAGRVRVGTTAGEYNPVFYGVVGAVGMVADGAGSLYAMRAVAALLCTGFLCLATWALLVAARSRGVWLGLLVGLTPTFVYSSVVLAPNGLEMAAGLAAWSTLLSLFGRAEGAPRGREELGLVVAAAAASAVLATIRTLGPVWLLMIAACVLVLTGLPPVWARARRRPWLYGLAASAVLCAGLENLAWTWLSGLGESYVVPGQAAQTPGLLDSMELPLWAFQAIAAMPYRNNPAPVAVYPLYLTLLVVTILLGWRCATRRNRAATGLACLLGLAVPAALVAATLATWGGNWQGRYALPFLVGVPLLASWTEPARAWSGSRHRQWWFAGAAGTWLLAAVLAVVKLQTGEVDRPVSNLDPNWVHGPVLLTVGLLVAGGVLLTATLWRVGDQAAQTSLEPSAVDLPV